MRNAAELLKMTTTQYEARKIMGGNFIEPERVAEVFKFNVSEFYENLGLISFPPETLQELKESHILFPDPGLSIINMRYQHPKFFSREGPDCLGPQEFANQTLNTPSWRLVRKGIAPNSTEKSWDEQLPLLQPEEEAPGARVLVIASILNFLSSPESLVGQYYYARTDDTTNAGRRVVVRFVDCLMDFCVFTDDYKGPKLGISSAQKVRF